MPQLRCWGLAMAACCLLILATGTASAADTKGSTASGPVVEAVTKHLGIFLTTPERREGFERIELKGDRLEIWFMRPVTKNNRDTLGCDGLKWLLMGRLAIAGGVKPLLDDLRMVNEVTLIFYDVQTHVKPDRKGNYSQERAPQPHGRFTISRSRAALIDAKNLAGTLRGRNCTRVGQSLVDSFWVRPE
ncbi:MAG: hypothetical protein ACE366_17115 [Bradymonadia bacterium]